MISLAIFDFDDTLVDNNILDYKAFEFPCKNLGLKPPTKDKIKHMRKNGFLAKQIMQHHLRNSKKKNLLDIYLQERKKFLQLESINYLKLKPNTKHLLEFFKKNKIICVLSTANKNKLMVLDFLKKNYTSIYFSDVLFMDDLGFKLDNSESSNRILIKSSLIKKTIKNYPYSRSQIIFIGNSIEDYESAKKLRISFIYFQNNHLPKVTNKRFIVVHSMIELKKYFLKCGVNN